MKAAVIEKELRELGKPELANHSKRFFKTGAGEYAEGDIFIGIRVTPLRQTAKKYDKTALAEIEKLLHSTAHEVRLCAVYMLVNTFNQADESGKKAVYDSYLSNTAYINNWDLVDSSAYHIVGPYLEKRSKAKLTELAKSQILWERRIAIIATLHFIRLRDFKHTLRISNILLNDDHDLIHKAVGWMLREVGSRDINVELEFLARHYKKMPRTMLRYAIEKFPAKLRKAYLNGTI